MKTIEGNLITLAQQGFFDVIVHGCNCFNTMGAGIAVLIKEMFPAAWEADQLTPYGDMGKLGTCTATDCQTTMGGNVIVINAYTQYSYGREKRQADYDAIRSCMQWIKQNYSGKHIGLPMIGAGLAGGDWKIILPIMEQELKGENVTIVKFNAPSSLK